MEYNYEKIRTTNYMTESVQAATRLAEGGFYWGGVPGHEGKEAVLMAYTPVARRNAFQALLYKRAWEHGVAPMPIFKYEQLVELPWAGQVISHFHWLNGMTSHAKTRSEAKHAVIRFRKLIDECKWQDQKLIWSVHNVLPHGSIWEAEDIAIRQIMADAADLIHILTTDTVSATKEYFEIDERKVIYCPHPTYDGVYADHVTRDEARFQLGLDNESVLLVCFGAVMPYKGYEHLMGAFDRAQNKYRNGGLLRLLIAGHPADSQLCARIERWGEGRSDIFLRLKRIPDVEMQYMFRAADIVICPYEKTLNSGVAMLGTTFGLPVVGPNIGAFKDNIPESMRFLFRQNDPEDLERMLVVAAEAISESSVEKNGLRSLGNLSPDYVSGKFIEESMRRLGIR